MVGQSCLKLGIMCQKPLKIRFRLVVWIFFPDIGNVIIPFDSYWSEGYVGSTTKQLWEDPPIPWVNPFPRRWDPWNLIGMGLGVKLEDIHGLCIERQRKQEILKISIITMCIIRYHIVSWIWYNYIHVSYINHQHYQQLYDTLYYNLVGGLEHVLFFHSVGNVIIPTDDHILQRGRSTTKQ